ncbi:hypothetical protein PMI26_03276 [Pseudomonas sp. GM33]|nr:hypothetical protein PMI26_03276 [Pseudomonas sp. GM33]
MRAATGFSITKSFSWEEASFCINDEPVPWNLPGIALRRGQSNKLTVQAPWLDGVQIKLGLVNDAGLVIGASPAFGQWSPKEGDTAEWTLTPENLSGRVRLVFLSREFDQVHEFPCWVMSSNLSDEGYATWRGSVIPMPEGVKEFWPDTSLTVIFRAKPDSPIAGFPLMLKVQAKQSGADPVTSKPLLMTPTTDHEWDVTGVTEAREVDFDLIISGQGMTPFIVSDCIRRSSNLLDYVTIRLNRVEVPADGARFKGGVSSELSAVAKPGSPSLYYVRLYWEKGGGELEGSRFISKPDFEYAVEKMAWNVHCPSHTRGEFALRIQKNWSSAQARIRCFLEPQSM